MSNILRAEWWGREDDVRSHVDVAVHQEHDLNVLLMDLASKQNDLATQFGISDEVQDPDAPVSTVFGENWEFIHDNIDNLV